MITDKGIALLAAIDAGLCKKTDKGYDITEFTKFWELYQKDLANAKKCNNLICEQAKNKCDNGYKHRNYLKSMLLILFSFAFGCILQKTLAVIA